MSKFEKPMSNVERMFLVYNGLRPPFANQLVIEGKRSPPKTALKKALKASTKANPGATLSLGNMTDDLVWRAGTPPPLKHIDAPDWSGHDDKNAPFLQQELNAYRGPSCEVLSVKAKDRHYLVFRSLHAVMDGRGTLFWAQDFMRALRGEEPIGHPSVIIPDDLSASITDEKLPLPPPTAKAPFAKLDQERSNSHYEWRRLSIDKPLRSSMLTEIAVSLGKLSHKDHEGVVRYIIPQDLRHHCPEERSTGNLIGYLFLDVSPDSTAESLGMSLIRQLYQKSAAASLNSYQAVAQYTQGHLHFHIKHSLAEEHKSGYVFSAAISNLGLIDKEGFDAPKFDVESGFFIPPFGDWPGFVVLAGFEDRIEATIAMPDMYCVDGQLDAFANAVSEALTKD